MTVRFVFPVIITAALLTGSSAAQDSIPPSSEEAFYKILYEQGFYEEAIRFIDSSSAGTPPGNERLFCLASCHIARGDTAAGAAVFNRMLDGDSSLRLDTLLTPPKILQVFTAVQAARRSHVAAGKIASETAEAAAPDSGSLSIPSAGESTGIGTIVLKPVLPPLLRYPLGFVPGGIGHFRQRSFLRGTLLLLAQGAAAGGCCWAYRKRQSFYDATYGWTGKNREVYNHYTGYCRLGLTVLACTYTFEIIDYFVILHKKDAYR